MKKLAAPVALALVVCLTIPPVSFAETEHKLTGGDRVGKDPQIVVLVRLENIMTLVDDMLDRVSKINKEITPEKIEEGFAKIEKELGFPLRDDLLSQLGPEFGVVIDLPPLDEIFEHAPGFPKTATSILMGTGVFAQVRDAEKVHRSIRKLLASEEGAEVVDGEDGLVRLRFPMDSPFSGADSSIEFIYGIRDGWMALGMNPDWVASTLAGPDKGQRLTDGADYARVMSHLDADPHTVVYANLPEVLDLVQDSNMLKMMLGANEEARAVVDAIANEEFLGVGWGYTSIELDGGARTSSFGPSAFSGGVMMVGIVAAIAIPNLLNAIDRGKQKRTMADLRSIGTAIESYSIDNNRYPKTDHWQSVEVLTEHLQPVYIRTLPTVDGWGRLFRVWSDGESYVLVSAGKDGELDQDWIEPEQRGATTSFNSDIVFSDGQFVTWPEGTQQ